jgi:hypothetical protein
MLFFPRLDLGQLEIFLQLAEMVVTQPDGGIARLQRIGEGREDDADIRINGFLQGATLGRARFCQDVQSLDVDPPGRG